MPKAASAFCGVFLLIRLAHGRTFAAFTLDNEYSSLGRLSRIRSQNKQFNRILRKGPVKLRKHFHGLKPSQVFYYTGAHIYEYLRYQKMMYFFGLPEPTHPRFATHSFGITRNALNPDDVHGGGGLQVTKDVVKERLAKVYGEEVPAD